MKPKLRSRPGFLRGFTLIELIIVVVIMATIAAVLVPAILSRVQRARQVPAQQISQTAPQLRVTGEGGLGARAATARIDASDVDVLLRVADVLDGATVHSRYTAEFTGRFVLRHTGKENAEVVLNFPFPEDMAEARDVSFEVEGPQGKLHRPDDVQYGLSGIQWSTRMTASSTLTTIVRYTAAGRDAFTYDVSPGRTGRTGRANVRVRVANGRKYQIPASSLQPTLRSDDRLEWKFGSLIAHRPIVVRLPAGSSPLGRLIFLFQLAAIAILVFGAGFWFMSEEVCPGALDDFRWGHFLLLASNYAMFFVVFAITQQAAPLPFAGLLALATSLPMLGFHVARVIDLRFALSRALPLAVFTIGVLTAFVYAHAHRPAVLVFAAVVSITYVTIRYRAFTEARQVHRRRRKARALKNALEKKLAERGAALSKLSDERDQSLRRARQALDVQPCDLVAQRTRLQRSFEALADVQADVSFDPSADADGTSVDDIAPRIERFDILEDRWRGLIDGLQTATDEYTNKRQIAEARAQEAEGKLGRAIETARRTMIRQEYLEADSALTKAREALEEGLERAEHPKCNTGFEGRRIELITLRENVVDRTQVLSDLADQARRAEAKRAVSEKVHCSACGGACAADQPFCGTCGTRRPERLECPQCGDTTRVLTQLTKRRWAKVKLHCEGCGGALDTPQGAGSLAPQKSERPTPRRF